MSGKKLSDFRPQARNANKHTQRGLGMLDESIAKVGWIGAITTAADGETFDGSARLETVYSRFGEDVEPIIVRSKGDRPIIHIREDIPSADDPRAKELSIAANRIAEVDLNYDLDVLLEYEDDGIDLSKFWFEEELQNLWKGDEETPGYDDEQDEDGGSGVDSDRYVIPIVLNPRENQIWQAVKRGYGLKDDKKVFLKLLEGVSLDD